MENVKKKTAALIVFVLLGAAAGVISARNSNISISLISAFPDNADLSEMRQFISSFCKSTFIQALLIFISGFTILPFALDIPLLAARGFAIGSTALLLNTDETRAVILFVSYILITLIFVPLMIQADTFRKNTGLSLIRKTAEYTLSFLTVSGAAILIRFLPTYISDKIL